MASPGNGLNSCSVSCQSRSVEPDGKYQRSDAPDALHDFPLDCTFCGEFVPIEADEPLRMVVTSWKNPAVQQLHVAHRACLDGATVTPRAAPPAPD